ncbi:hypothetical protein [Paenibacillus brevis]|uniref:Uncharacterized protein n=1 Tax=Paenibacillus brevis TaxID=2841508 RepID=A0ABS6FT45_9BACL|nr:hypothetical protein [Paenibacillus brevis]MBU5672662.1 hypothetical protein [Paenibacillus brevis]
MYTYINKAIQACKPLSLLLDDGSKLSGMPSWPEDRSRVKIKAHGGAAWIPLADIKHVTT